ncbi:unnamed protein product [Vitrella brassicaformis CCMP3155]|uniref:Uncharacterized protein n=2 Tax=Vitrella brassicaformis TaxID=1169539 RepID=A0A0G4EEF1_VITBC|nr:unnamed protein product [Vitrella brassicaformis CCMP3155]|eukprot:CEL94066.1 unnamed protein product [Vitrella brassicaformis CCMP3155]
MCVLACAPPVVATPVDVDDVTKDLEHLKDPDAVDVSDAEDTIGGLLGSEGEEPPIPPPVESTEDFSSRLLKAINVAKVARKDDMAGLAKPNATQEETKARRKAVVKALMRNLQKAAVDRSTKLSDVSSSPAEVLLSAVTLVTTVETADETENDDMDTAEAGVATFKALVNVSADTISQPDDTLANAVKEVQGLQYYLDGAAGLLRQLNKTAKANRHLRRLTPAAKESYHTLSSDVIGTTAQLADSLATRAAAHSNDTAEVAGAKTRLKVVRTDTASGATLTIRDTNVAVDMPSLPSIPPAVCADGGGLRESVQMTFWADDPYAYAAQEEVPMANLTANDTLRNAAQGTLAVSARQCGSDLQLTAGDVKQEPFRLFIPRPSADSVPAAGNVSINGTESAYRVDVVCGFWNTSTHQWDTQGCDVNVAVSNETTLCCVCTHLTQFASLFKSVIRESNVDSALTETSIKSMADPNAWVKNVAGAFVVVMIGIHVVCLAVSLLVDCRNPVTDQILIDLWMTDVLLDLRHRGRRRLRESMRQCYGRCYHPWLCDFLICRIIGGLYMHCRRREPTLHLQELRTIRAVRSDLNAEKDTPSLSSVLEPGSRSRLHSDMSASTGRSAFRPRLMRSMSRLSRQLSRQLSVSEQILPLHDFIKSSYRRHRASVTSEAAVTDADATPAKSFLPLKYSRTKSNVHLHFLTLEKEATPAPAAIDGTIAGPAQLEETGQPANHDKQEAEQEQQQQQVPMPDADPSAARKRIKKSVSLALSGGSEEEDQPEDDRSPLVSATPAAVWPPHNLSATAAAQDHPKADKGFPKGRWTSILSFASSRRPSTPQKEPITLIKSGVLREALRKRLQRELQRQMAAAVLIQRTYRRKWKPKIETTRHPIRAMMIGKANWTRQAPQGSFCTSRGLSFISSAGMSGQRTQEALTYSGYEGQATSTTEEGPLPLPPSEPSHHPGVEQAGPSYTDLLSPVSFHCYSTDFSQSSSMDVPTEETAWPLSEPHETPLPTWQGSRGRKGRTSGPQPQPSGLPDEGEDDGVPLDIGESIKRPSIKRQVTIAEPSPTEPARRKSVTELWGDLNAEVDLLVTRSLRRIEYVEWSAPKMYTAVQRTFFFGSVTLGILMVTAMFFDQTTQTQRDTEVVLMTFDSGNIAWRLTMRQLAVLLWCVVLSKPMPVALFFLFRKTVPYIPFAPRASRVGSHPAFRATQKSAGWLPHLSDLLSPQISVRSLKRVADVAGRHSVLKRWRVKERVGIVIALLYWLACSCFLLLFAFSERLAEGTEGRSRHLVYQDFVLACSVEALTEFVFEPLVSFIVLSLLLMLVLRVDTFDWVVLVCPGWFDFTFVRAQSLHELTIQQRAMRDAYGLTMGVVGFARLNMGAEAFTAF